MPSGIRVRGTISGGARSGARVGSGAGYVDVSLQLAGNGLQTELTLPAGLLMISKRAGVQHGLLVQDVKLTVPARRTKRWLLSMYCANQSRSAADEGAKFKLGPIVDDPALKDLFALLEGREIAQSKVGIVQDAVWEITDGAGLTSDARELIDAFPRRA